MNSELDELCIDTLRFLSVDMVQKANSGHPGMPMGAAAVAYTLWDRYLWVDPVEPRWADRDRFVLSAGHGCALLYSLLHLSGFDLPIEELKNFRQWGSHTPGHPEYGLTPGVEATTGPLGQGIANAVGMAIAEESLAARFNRPGHEIVDHHTYVMCSDGDLMEGVASEAASLAGHLALGKLIVLWDDNRISIEGSTDLAFTEDPVDRFAAYGWHVQRVEDGNDVEAISRAIEAAQAETGKPSFVAVRSRIGFGSPNKQDTASAHGEPLGADEVTRTKEAQGWPLEPAFFVPEEVSGRFRLMQLRGASAHAEWQLEFDAYTRQFPELAEEFQRRMRGDLPEGWQDALPVFDPADGAQATREAGGKVLNALAAGLPEILGGSADLAPSTKTLLEGEESFSAKDRTGRNLHFGVREHAMGAIVNGLAYHGGFVPYGSTFLTFSDYMRPALRLAALSHLNVINVFTHDSVGLGEDGPTHQPVEHVAALRLIPASLTIRPADANETAAAWRVAIVERRPVNLVLTRQKLPVLDLQLYPGLAMGVTRGGYVLADAGAGAGDGATGAPDAIIVASGSEVSVALEARELLAAKGVRTRVVSMPCVQLFIEQAEEYRAAVITPGVPVVVVEAGVTAAWRGHLAQASVVREELAATRVSSAYVGIDRFGASAPGDVVMRELGMTAEAVADAVLRVYT